jgi:uncharacterized protein
MSVERGAAVTGPPSRPNGGASSRAAGDEVGFEAGDGVSLHGFVARPNFSAASGSGRHAVVLAHGFPVAGQGNAAPSYGYDHVAVRLAAETGAVVFTFDFRGTGRSAGDFSLRGWQADLDQAIRHVADMPGIEKVWLVGFAAGGTLSMCAAGADPSIAGVAALAPPAEFVDRGADARRLVAQARAMGMIRSRNFPTDVGQWARELREARPAQLVARIPPRPLLIVHGANDDVVPMTDARELAEAADKTSELRIIGGAGHMLLHDPRAIALLLGWFDRYLGAAA